MECNLEAYFLVAYGVLQVGLVTPLVQQLKKWLIGSFPVQPIVYTAILSFLVAWGLAAVIGIELSNNCLIEIALGGHITSQATHALWKGKKK